MTPNRLPAALLVLKWVLGLVILAEAAHFALSSGAGLAFAKTGLPHLIRPILAWTEIVAAVLFLVPHTAVAGGRLLILVLAVAIVVHFLHGWFDVGALAVYAASAWAVVTWNSAPVSQQ